MKRLLVTAALPYSNGRLHVGHIAGCYLPADIYVRHQRLKGRDVRFICGSDDHGVAIMLTSEKEGRTPRETAQHYNELQRRDFEGLGISFDIYSSTCGNPVHSPTSQDFFLRIHEEGFFEKKKSLQFYDESKEVFLPDRFVTGTCSFCGATDQNGDQCENCGKVLDVDTLRDAISVFSGEPAVVRETVHWFLDLSQFESKVEQWIAKADLREHTRKYLKGLLGTGLVKRSMTRDLSWGIPVPLSEDDAKGKVLYVWFDAPIGYISNTKELCKERDGNTEAYESWWKSDDCDLYHFIGEDNTIFHCIIWIAMLSAEGTFHLPEGVIVNQFLNIQFPDKEEEKISKSRGTAVWIGDYLESGGDPDSLRYYLATISPERARTVYKPEDLIQKNNADLANTLGNFVNRVLSFTSKYFGSSVIAVDEEGLDESDRTFRREREVLVGELKEELDRFEFRVGIERIFEYVRGCNRYIDEKAPWKTRTSDEQRTQQTLAICMEAIHTIGVVLQPYLPGASRKILGMVWGESLGDRDSVPWSEALNSPSAGSSFGELTILFQKIDLAQSS